MTRGMNMDTIAALDQAATDNDIPLLKSMLFSDDDVTAMTAAEVLNKRGAKGREVLMDAFHQSMAAKDTIRAALINEYGSLGQKLY